MARVPKPTLAKLRDGTRKDRINTSEPKNSPVTFPRPPKYLDKIGAAYWRRIVQDVDPNLIQATDLKALEILCQHYSEWRWACAEVRENGRTQVVNEAGCKQVSVAYSIMNKQASIIHKMLAEFGFTPASRSRVEISQNAGGGLGSFIKAFAGRN